MSLSGGASVLQCLLAPLSYFTLVIYLNFMGTISYNYSAPEYILTALDVSLLLYNDDDDDDIR